MKSQKISFQNSNGETLSARLELPVDQQPHSYAVFAHCFTCNKNLNAVTNISRCLTLRGFGVLRFDFTGLGDSEGDFAETNFSSNVQDLIDAAQYMGENHGTVELMIGHSLGGAATLIAASRLKQVKAVATIGAPAEPEHVSRLFAESLDEIKESGVATVNIGGRPFTIKRQFVEDLVEHDPYERIKKLGKALLIMHSPIDTIVGIDNARKIYVAALHPKSFVSLDDADHLLMRKADSLYAGEMIGTWVGKYIKAPAPDPLKSEMPVVVRTGPKGYTTEVKMGRHGMLADEPDSVGGADLGPTPYDLLTAALGACTSMTLRMYADHKGWPVEDIIVHLEHGKVHAKDSGSEEEASKGGKIDQIIRKIEIDGDLTDEQRQRMMGIADRCPIHRTLHGDVRVLTSLLEDKA